MLPRWTRAGLYLYLGEAALQVVRLSGGWRPAVIAEASLPFTAGSPLEALPAFEAWLSAQGGARSRERMWLSLGSVHVPVLVLPWSVEIARDSLRRAMAGALLERQLQLQAGAFDITFGPLRFGEPVLAAFVSRDLHQAWGALAARQGLRLQACRPLLEVVWNRFYSTLVAGGEQLLVVEETRTLTLVHDHGRVQAASLRPTDGEAMRALVQLRPTAVFAPERYRSLPGGSTQWLGLRGGRGQSLAFPVACAVCGVW